MDPTPVRDANDDLPFLRLVAHCLLSRLVGPQTFTLDEIEAVERDYRGMRTIYNVPEQTFTLSLKPFVKSEGPG